jgi:hypothetical protein
VSVARGEPELVSKSAAHALVSQGPVIAVVWRGEIAVPVIRSALLSLRGVGARYPGNVIAAFLVEPRVPIPSDDARKALAELFREGKEVRCGFIVAEGSGFQQSLVRSVVAGLTLVVRPPFPLKVFSAAGEACAWASKQGPPLSQRSSAPPGNVSMERELVSLLEATRARIG